MIKWIIILTVATVVIADIIAFRRAIRYIRSTMWRIALGVLIFVADAMPYIPMSLYIIVLHDNTTTTMHTAMWFMTLYVLLTLPRLGFYLFWLPRKSSRTATLLGAMTAATISCTLIYGIIKTRTNMEVRHVSLQFQNLPASFDGYRIALFSDMHIGTMLSPQKQCKKLVDIINATQPDAVAFCGDLINIRHTELTPRLVTTLRDIKARDGVYAVLGNHDRGVYVKDSVELSVEENTAYVVEHIHNCDWRLLRDSVAYVRRAEDSIAFVGIDFSDSLLVYKHSFETPSNLDTESIFANIPDSTFRITLSHLPQVWHLLRDRSHSDLTLAGHVHSSQIKFSCDNLQLSPAMIMYREWSGLYEEQGRTLYINDGIGVVGFFMRIGTRPEITLIELRK